MNHAMINYRKIKNDDLPLLLELWLSSFDDEPEAAELFFKKNLSYTHGYIAEDGKNIAAALYLVYCRLCGMSAHYLCGAATKASFRRRGIMTELIEFALADASARGDVYSVLLPADKNLYDFYAKRGYLPKGRACRAEFDTADFGTIPDTNALPDTDRLQENCLKDKFLLWNNNYLLFARDYYSVYGAKYLRSNGAFAFCYVNGSMADVFYAVYNDIKELKQILFDEGVKRFTLTGSVEQPLFEGVRPMTYGMVRPLQKEVDVPDSVFIGITLS